MQVLELSKLLPVSHLSHLKNSGVSAQLYYRNVTRPSPGCREGLVRETKKVGERRRGGVWMCGCDCVGVGVVVWVGVDVIA